ALVGGLAVGGRGEVGTAEGVGLFASGVGVGMFGSGVAMTDWPEIAASALSRRLAPRKIPITTAMSARRAISATSRARRWSGEIRAVVWECDCSIGGADAIVRTLLPIALEGDMQDWCHAHKLGSGYITTKTPRAPRETEKFDRLVFSVFL